MGFRIDASDLLRGLSEAKLKTMFAVEIYGKTAAMKMEQTAKQDAPWKDRTGLARQTIAAVADWEGNTYRIGIAGNMNYSPYLELARMKNYAVLWPTVQKLTPEILRGIARFL